MEHGIIVNIPLSSQRYNAMVPSTIQGQSCRIVKRYPRLYTVNVDGYYYNVPVWAVKNVKSSMVEVDPS